MSLVAVCAQTSGSAVWAETELWQDKVTTEGNVKTLDASVSSVPVT
jgi:hypothetical protein